MSFSVFSVNCFLGQVQFRVSKLSHLLEHRFKCKESGWRVDTGRWGDVAFFPQSDSSGGGGGSGALSILEGE